MKLIVFFSSLFSLVGAGVLFTLGIMQSNALFLLLGGLLAVLGAYMYFFDRDRIDRMTFEKYYGIDKGGKWDFSQYRR